MIARQTDSEAEYKSILYKKILESNPGSATTDILVKLIELAWKSRNEDVVAVANYLYTACAKEEVI
jgi:hypothetical protein